MMRKLKGVRCAITRRLPAMCAFFFAAMPCLAVAESPKTIFPAVSYSAFPLPLVRTYVSCHAGLLASKANLNDPYPNDYPPRTTIALEDKRSYPAYKKGARYFFPGRNIVRVYRISDLQPYKTIQADLARLRVLLRERPASLPDSGEAYQRLPDYPPRNAGHAFQAKLSYVDAPWGSGIFYLTQFVQGPGNFANNEEMTGIFQGVSADGAFYLSADFRVTHPRLPFGVDGKPLHDDDFKTDAIMLAKQRDDAFTPSLQKLRAWVASLKIE